MKLRVTLGILCFLLVPSVFGSQKAYGEASRPSVFIALLPGFIIAALLYFIIRGIYLVAAKKKGIMISERKTSMSNGQFNKVVMVPTKNVGVAALLAFFFGPLGMFYSTVVGAIVMMILYPIVYLLTFGLGLLVLHPIVVIWAAVHANNYNKKLLSGSQDIPEHNIKIEVSVPPPSKTVDERKTQDQVRRGTMPGFVESAMTKGLISQARQLEAEGIKGSSEQAVLLWKEALKIGGLSAADELLCHYYVGLYYFNIENLAEGIKHHERIVLSDPDLAFLEEVNDAIKSRSIGDLYKNLSTAYQSLARTEIKEQQGIKTAIEYLQGRVNILRHMATPSILFELGSYYSLYGNREKAGGLMRKALEAPTYGSDFQENAKKMAGDFLQTKGTMDSAKEGREDRIKIDQPLALGPEPEEKKSPLLKWILGATLVIGAALALFLLLQPSQYKKYYSKAKEAFGSGNYSEALTLVKLAKDEKATTELNNLETEIRQGIHDTEARTEQQNKQREYDDFYRGAKNAFDQQDLVEADRLAQLAAARISTREISDLRRQIQVLEAAKLQSEIKAGDGTGIAQLEAARLQSEIKAGDGTGIAHGVWEVTTSGYGGKVTLTFIQDGESLRIWQTGGRGLYGRGTITGNNIEWSRVGNNAFFYKGKISNDMMGGTGGSRYDSEDTHWYGIRITPPATSNPKSEAANPIQIETRQKGLKEAEAKAKLSELNAGKTSPGAVETSAPGNAQVRSSVKAGVDILGNWDITIKERQEGTFQLVITQTGETLSVRMIEPRVELAGTGTVRGNIVEWKVVRGSSSRSFSGTIQGDRMAGMGFATIKTSRGERSSPMYNWTAVRNARGPHP